jgi:hypothetical protein
MHEHLVDEHPNEVYTMRKLDETTVHFVKRVRFHRFFPAHETRAILARQLNIEVVEPWQNRWRCCVCNGMFPMSGTRIECAYCSASVCSGKGCYNHFISDTKHEGCYVPFD